MATEDGQHPNEPIAILGMGCRFPGGVPLHTDLLPALARRCQSGLNATLFTKI